MAIVIVPVIVVVVLIGSLIHDLIVHDWLISNVRVDPVLSDIVVVPNMPIKQEIDVSFDAKDSRWIFKLGQLQPAAYLIVLNLDSSAVPINKCDPSNSKSCPARTGGISQPGRYTEHFTIRWDAKGVHTFNIDVSVDGTRLGQLTAGVNIH